MRRRIEEHDRPAQTDQVGHDDPGHRADLVGGVDLVRRKPRVGIHRLGIGEAGHKPRRHPVVEHLTHRLLLTESGQRGVRIADEPGIRRQIEHVVSRTHTLPRGSTAVNGPAADADLRPERPHERKCST